MKSFAWNVSVNNPLNATEEVWFYSGNSLASCCDAWLLHTGNYFLTYHKLHNIFHGRNKGDAMLINVKKVNL